MLAFYIHQILEMTDWLFKLCRKVSRRFKELWTDLTDHFKYILFDRWEHMRCFDLNQNELSTSRNSLTYNHTKNFK